MKKNDPRQKTKHHKKMLSNGGTNDKENISIVHRKAHEAFHYLFKNMNTNQIANELNSVWIDPAFELIVRKRIKEEDYPPSPHTEQSF